MYNKVVALLSILCAIVLVTLLLQYRFSAPTAHSMFQKPGITSLSQLQCQMPSKLYNSWKVETNTSFRPHVEINCTKLILHDHTERDKMRREMSKWRSSMKILDLSKKARNCSWLQDFLSGHYYSSLKEKSFPLAFTFIVHDNPEQVLRLLSVLYREQNLFCVHPDAKSAYVNIFVDISRCFRNIVVPLSLKKVVWGHSSILEAQMKCMDKLVSLRAKQENKWKYLLNICGKEVPLATNREIVEHLMKLNGTSNIIAHRVNPSNKESSSRILYPVVLDSIGTKLRVDRSRTLPDPPFNKSEYYKSTGYHALSFNFTRHLLHNKTANSVLKFFYRCKNPEEHFYATIYMMPGVPGGYNPKVNHLLIYIISVFWKQHPQVKCEGKFVRNVCVVGGGDLQRVLAQSGRRFFHNKYHMEYDHSVMYCMEKRLMARNRDECVQDCDGLSLLQFFFMKCHDLGSTVKKY